MSAPLVDPPVKSEEAAYAVVRQRQYERDLAYERERRQRVEDAASELLEAAKILGWGSGEPFYDGIRWLTEAAERAGYDTRLALDDVAPISKGQGWPSTQHIRLHFLAERDGGWCCQECGVGLIDVCSDDDMVVDAVGKRLLRPNNGKRLPTLDHVVPRALGGSDAPGNLRLTCRSCNSSKGAS